MNFGTKLRTALRIAVSVNNALCVTSAAINDFHLGWLSWLWIALTIASDFVISAVTTYFNNDYSEVSARYTQEMRLEKEAAKCALEEGKDPEDDEIIEH